MRHMVGVDHHLKMSAPLLSRFGCNDVLKILMERVTQSVNYSGNYEGVCRTTPDLLKSVVQTVGKYRGQPGKTVLPFPSLTTHLPSTGLGGAATFSHITRFVKLLMVYGKRLLTSYIK